MLSGKNGDVVKAHEWIKNIISWAKEQLLVKPTTKKSLRPVLNTECETEYFYRKGDNKKQREKAGGLKNCFDKLIAQEKLLQKELQPESSILKVF